MTRSGPRGWRGAWFTYYDGGTNMRRLDRLLWRVTDAVILVAVTGMVVLICLQVGSRLLGASISWTEELSRFFFIWTVWFGLAASFRAGSHPAITLLPDLAPPGLQWLFRALPMIATTILFAAVTWYGFGLMRQQIAFGEQSPILQIGMWLSTLPLVIGAALSIIGAIISGVFDDPVTAAFDEAYRDSGGAQP